MVDAVDVEIPGSCPAEKGVLDRDVIADFPAEAFGKAGADHGALAVLDEVGPLVIGHDELGEDLALVFDIDDELRKEVFLILIDATKPVVVGNRP